jgi:hypothetical protein
MTELAEAYGKSGSLCLPCDKVMTHASVDGLMSLVTRADKVMMPDGTSPAYAPPNAFQVPRVEVDNIRAALAKLPRQDSIETAGKSSCGASTFSALDSNKSPGSELADRGKLVI